MLIRSHIKDKEEEEEETYHTQVPRGITGYDMAIVGENYATQAPSEAVATPSVSTIYPSFPSFIDGNEDDDYSVNLDGMNMTSNQFLSSSQFNNLVDEMQKKEYKPPIVIDLITPPRTPTNPNTPPSSVFRKPDAPKKKYMVGDKTIPSLIPSTSSAPPSLVPSTLSAPLPQMTAALAAREKVPPAVGRKPAPTIGGKNLRRLQEEAEEKELRVMRPRGGITIKRITASILILPSKSGVFPRRKRRLHLPQQLPNKRRRNRQHQRRQRKK